MRLHVGEWIFSKVEKETLSACNLKWQAPSINSELEIRWIRDIYIWLCCFSCFCWVSEKSSETYFKHRPVWHLSRRFCISPPTQMSWIALNQQLSRCNAVRGFNWNGTKRGLHLSVDIVNKGQTNRCVRLLQCHTTIFFPHSVEWEINGEKERVSNIVYST